MAVDLNRLLEVCEKFIIDNRISCEEACIQDSVYENAPDLVQVICELVGYYEYPEDEDSDES